MVVIRLARGGAKKRPFFNIVVADSRLRRDGRFIERVGFYNPVASGAEQPLRVAFDRVEHWTGHGAQMSPTVRRLVEQAKPAAARGPRRPRRPHGRRWLACRCPGGRAHRRRLGAEGLVQGPVVLLAAGGDPFGPALASARFGPPSGASAPSADARDPCRARAR